MRRPTTTTIHRYNTHTFPSTNHQLCEAHEGSAFISTIVHTRNSWNCSKNTWPIHKINLLCFDNLYICVIFLFLLAFYVYLTDKLALCKPNTFLLQFTYHHETSTIDIFGQIYGKMRTTQTKSRKFVIWSVSASFVLLFSSTQHGPQ